MKYVGLAKGGYVAAALAIALLAFGPAQGRELQPETGLFPIALSDDLLLEFMQPNVGQEAAAEQWSEQHVKQFVRIPGVKAGQFLVASRNEGKDKPAFNHLSMYELTADTAPKLEGEVRMRLQDGRLQKGDRLFKDTPLPLLYRPLGTAVLAHDVPGANPQPMGSGPLSIDYLFVMSEPSTPDQEEAFNTWFDHQHVPDVLRVPGFVSGQRYVRVGGDWQRPRYLVIFQLKTRDHDATIVEIGRRIKLGITKMTPALGRTPGGKNGGIYFPVGPLALAKGFQR